MSVPTTVLSISYDGNESTVTPYSIPFPFLDTAHIFVATGSTTWATFGLLRDNQTGPTVEYREIEIMIEGDGVRFPHFLDVGDTLRDSDGRVVTVTEIRQRESGDDYDFIFFNVFATAGTFATGGVNEVIEFGTQGLVNLDPSDFTVTRLADGSGGSVVTADAVDEDETVVIFRQVPLTQPQEFQMAGPFPAASAEQAYDRLLMQIQQINRRVNVLEGVTETDYVHLPGGASEEMQGTKTWLNAAARGAVLPKFVGQFGSQQSDDSIWRSTATTVGAWAPYGANRYEKAFRVVDNATTVPSSGTRVVGVVFSPIFVTHLSFFTTIVEDSDIEIEVFAGATLLGTVTLDSGDNIATIASLVATEIPANTAISAVFTNTGSSGTLRKGLDVTLHGYRTSSATP